MVNFASRVIYTADNSVQIRVEVEQINPAQGTTDITNVFQFAFMVPTQKTIVPETYEEAMMVRFYIFLPNNSSWRANALPRKGSQQRLN